MPTQQDINEIASYLKSFEDGTRKHDQSSIHGCGSSHCLAGWKAYDDATKSGLQIDDFVAVQFGPMTWYQSAKLEKFCQQKADSESIFYFDEMDYAAKVWGLNEEEEDLLFDGDLTLQEMKENLKSIAVSHGLTYDPN
jgi:hypothetical protein